MSLVEIKILCEENLPSLVIGGLAYIPQGIKLSLALEIDIFET